MIATEYLVWQRRRSMTKERLLSSMEANSVRGEERSLSTERTDRDRRRRIKRATATLEGGRLHNLL